MRYALIEAKGDNFIAHVRTLALACNSVLHLGGKELQNIQTNRAGLDIFDGEGAPFGKLEGIVLAG
ncbi:hypothetical protein LguiB_005897 [Lonicera macranthoides]